MHPKVLPLACLLLPPAAAALRGKGSTNTTIAEPDQDGKYWLYGEGIKAAFIPYGASISNLIINDQYGIPRDLVGGFDNASYYSIDRQQPHFGGVPGRYANRIKNSSFVIDGTTYHVLPNENPTPASPSGIDTLHGGPDGWDWRNFTVVAYSNDSITFSIVDPDGKEGFPGEVVSYITYSLGKMTWDFKMVAIATTKRTPIMLTSHTYWNLDGFANNETNTAFNHKLYVPHGGQRVGVDSVLVPTGDILPNQAGSVNDFWTAPKQVGANMSSPDLDGNCGAGCTGYGMPGTRPPTTPLCQLTMPLCLDNCYIVDQERDGAYDWRKDGLIVRLQSAWSGIQLDLYSDQEALQLYSCNGQNGSITLKKTQGLFDNAKFPRTIPQYGCVVLEVQDWIDAINQPEWQRSRKQIYGPGDDPYIVQASYRFSINGTQAAS